MGHTKSISLVLTLLALSLNTATLATAADDTSPDVIFKKVAATYKNMETYKSEGVITSDIITPQISLKMETKFTILLKKPNLYLITWSKQDFPMPGMGFSGTVWSNGKQPYLYTSSSESYSKIKNDVLAIASATGISGGAAHTIPSLFLNTGYYPAPTFLRLKNPKLEASEKIENDDCYVITGPTDNSIKETFWISKATYHILKFSRELEQPKNAPERPTLSEEAMKQALKDSGQKVTKESLQQMKDSMKRINQQIPQLKGASIEFHSTISSPKLSKKQFQFTPPKDATLVTP